MMLSDIPELSEKIGDFGSLAAHSLSPIAGDDLWLIVAIFVYEAQ